MRIHFFLLVLCWCPITHSMLQRTPMQLQKRCLSGVATGQHKNSIDTRELQKTLINQEKIPGFYLNKASGILQAVSSDLMHFRTKRAVSLFFYARLHAARYAYHMGTPAYQEVRDREWQEREDIFSNFPGLAERTCMQELWWHFYDTVTPLETELITKINTHAQQTDTQLQQQLVWLVYAVPRLNVAHAGKFLLNRNIFTSENLTDLLDSEPPVVFDYEHERIQLFE